MADFVQTMRDWKRMCNSMGQEDEYSACDKCKLRSFECPPIYERECDGADWQLVEKVVTAWAAENPEPKYPSWKEWLEEQRVVVHFDSVDNHGTKMKWELTNKSNCSIPADIAEKLGVKPK